MFSLGETNEGPGKAIWNQAWHGVNIKSCEVMVLVQLFIIRIALSNWAAPSYPFSLLLYHTAAPPQSWRAHTHSQTLVLWWWGWQISSSLFSKWFTCHRQYHNKPQFLFKRILHKCHKIRQTPHLPHLIVRCLYLLCTTVEAFTESKLLLPFSQIHLSHRYPPSFSTAPSLNFLISLFWSRSGPPERAERDNGVNAR